MLFWQECMLCMLCMLFECMLCMLFWQECMLCMLFECMLCMLFWQECMLCMLFECMLCMLFSMSTPGSPLRITSQFPKNEPDSEKTLPDHHGTFEKSPTKPPPGLTARLSSPTHKRAPPAAKNHDGNGPPAGAVIRPEAPNNHHTNRISNYG